MKKVLVCLSNYGDQQLLYLHQLFIAYDRVKHFQIDLILHTTAAVDLNRYSFRVHQVLCDPAIKRDLALKHRQVMINAQDRYDLFVYSENDMLITEPHLLAFCQATANLPDPYVAGFIRYERNRRRSDDEELYLPDAHPLCGGVYQAEHFIRGRRYIELMNRHQGFFLLTQDQLKRAIQSPLFGRYIPGEPLNLEIGASLVYIGCGMRKVIPVDVIDDLMVHHLSDKYVNSDDPPWNTTPPHTLRSLKALFCIEPPKAP